MMDIESSKGCGLAKGLPKTVYSVHPQWQMSHAEKKASLPRRIPFQKGGFVGLAWTWDDELRDIFCSSVGLPQKYVLFDIFSLVIT
jgi:hypothetical protein